jgi:trk system potassium uptake protein TrkA
MYVVIVGAGEVGSYVAQILVDEGHEVALVDSDHAVTERVGATIDALVLTGSGVQPAVLRRAGIERADLLLAVTAVDEVNLITSMTARKHGPPEMRAVARIHQSPDAAGSPALSAEDLGLDALISPEEAIASATMDVLRYSGSGEMRELAGGRLVLVGMDVGAESPLVHGTLAQVRRGLEESFLVLAVQAQEGLRIPTGSDRLHPGDRAFVLTTPGNVTELAILSGYPWHHVRRVLIIGCGDTGMALASKLIAHGRATTIIEQDAERAQAVANALPHALVVHADASDPELLRDRIEDDRIDGVVVLLPEPEKSLLIGMFVGSLGTGKVVVRCDQPGYVQLANAAGIDAVLSPKRTMADALLRYVRTDAVESTFLLGNHEAEVLHFRIPDVPKRTELLRCRLEELPFPPGTLVGAVMRNGSVEIASGGTRLHPGDELLVVSRTGALGKLESLLS